MICYPDQLEFLLTVASNLNAIGPDYLYIFPGLSVYELEQSLRIMNGTFDYYEISLFNMMDSQLTLLSRLGC